MEKTEWGTQIIVFLGMLLNTITQTISVLIDKKNKALRQLMEVIEAKKVQVIQLQRLTGLINFISRAIVSGRASMRRIYAKYAGMKQHYHVRVDKELRMDCAVWLDFLQQPLAICRPFVDFQDPASEVIPFFTDVAKSDTLGLGYVFNHSWVSQKWDGFVKQCDPSIEYLELFALTVAIDLWGHKFCNHRITIFCDNQAVVHMVNKSAAKCVNCMVLIRLIVINSMRYNFRVTNM